MSHDIFVSYAHVDDAALPPDEGWVTQLVRRLQIQLGKQIGRSDAFSLWMDPQLSGNQPLTAEILTQLGASATILIIHSKGYQRSEWCQREKNGFLALAGGLASRLFVVERDQTERPAELVDRRGYRFWSADSISRKARTLGDPLLPVDQARYYDLIADLAGDIADELVRQQASRSVVVPSPLPAPPPPPLATVLLAEVTDDLEPVRDEVRRYLEQQRIRVLPGQVCYPRNASAAFTAAVDADLRDAKLFVQLLSAVAGKKASDDDRTFVRLQLERAQAAPVPLVQWRAPDLSLTGVDPEQAVLLQGDSVHAVGLEEFKSAVVTRALAQPTPIPVPRVGLVFVNVEHHDRSFAEDLGDLLTQLGADYVLPLRDGDPADVRADLDRNLLDCDKLMIVYGTTTPIWVREQLRYARKVLPQRSNGQPVLAIYHGPPPPKDDIGFKLANQLTIDGTGGFDTHALRTFLSSRPPNNGPPTNGAPSGGAASGPPSL